MEAVSKREESSAQTNAVTQPVKQNPHGRTEPVGAGGRNAGKVFHKNILQHLLTLFLGVLCEDVIFGK